MRKRLDGKTAIVTGATSGMGKATAILFAREGAKVVLVGRREKLGKCVARQIRDEGGEAVYIKGDVSKGEQVQHFVAEALKAYAKIDVLFNNAGINPEEARRPLADCSEEIWAKTMDINAKGVFLTSKYVIPHMIKNRGGSIINTASIFSKVANQKRGIYSASKGAVMMLTKAMALDYAPYHIRVNCICPGLVETEIATSFVKTARRDPDLWRCVMCQYPLGRVGTPEDIAQSTLFLASDESGWITGASLSVDGGYTAR